jgi:hypothetical protein
MGTITGSNANYAIPLTGCSEGRVTLTLAANSVTGTRSGPVADVIANGYIDFTNPTITSITVSNATISPASYLNITVNMSESVTVTGSPRIPVVIGSTTRYATYALANDAKTLLFRYLIQTSPSDIDTDGIDLISPLDLNGGSIADLATNAISDLTFTVPNTTGVKVAQLPNAVTITSLGIANGSIIVNFTESATNGSTITNYQYSVNNGSTFSNFSPVDTVTPLTITGLTNGTLYSVLIRPVVGFGTPPSSNMVQATPAAITTVTIALTASATSAVKGTVITITATTGMPGKVNFYWNSKKIPGCIKRTATTSATCSWKPNVTGAWNISAMLDPTDPAYNNAYALELPVTIVNRTGNR